jgi:preprotein translocase subunit YajC
MQAAQSLIFLVLLMVIFYFMLIRPQKRRVQQHQQLLDSIGIGDEIVTIGGLRGTIRAIGDEEVEIEASPGVTLRFVKSAIARRLSEDLEEDSDTTTPSAIEAPEEEKS